MDLPSNIEVQQSSNSNNTTTTPGSIRQRFFNQYGKKTIVTAVGLTGFAAFAYLVYEAIAQDSSSEIDPKTYSTAMRIASSTLIGVGVFFALSMLSLMLTAICNKPNEQNFEPVPNEDLENIGPRP